MALPKTLQEAREKMFFDSLSIDGNVTHAIFASGMDRQQVYRQRRKDPAFAARWEEALDAAADKLEEEARRRAVDGIVKPLYYQGAPIHLYRTVLNEDGTIKRDDEGREVREVVRDANNQPVQAVEYTYSDGMLSLLLRGARPEKYRDNKSSVEVSGPGGGPVELTAVSETERARRIAYLLQQGLLAAQNGSVVASQDPEMDDGECDLL